LSTSETMSNEGIWFRYPVLSLFKEESRGAGILLVSSKQWSGQEPESRSQMTRSDVKVYHRAIYAARAMEPHETYGTSEIALS
jgi:hypothetical protein